MLASATAALIGSFLDWVTITATPRILPTSELERAHPVSGIEEGDGWVVILLAVLVINGALLLWIRRKSFWGWLGFLSSVVIGGISISDYRAIVDAGSGFMQQLDVVGEVDQGIGILFVAAGAVAGVIFSLLGIAATPHRSSPD
jgi:hypothetical protein